MDIKSFLDELEPIGKDDEEESKDINDVNDDDEELTQDAIRNIMSNAHVKLENLGHNTILPDDQPHAVKENVNEELQ